MGPDFSVNLKVTIKHLIKHFQSYFSTFLNGFSEVSLKHRFEGHSGGRYKRGEDKHPKPVQHTLD